MFCDLRGYTAFTETAEPEEVLDFLREYHGAYLARTKVTQGLFLVLRCDGGGET